MRIFNAPCMLNNEKNNISGIMLLSAVLVINVLAVFFAIIIPEGEWSEWIFYAITELSLLAIVFAVAKLMRFNFTRESGTKAALDAPAIFYTAVICVGVLLFGSVIANFVYYGFEALGYKSPDLTLPAMDNALKIIVAVIVLGLIPALCEETLMRGVILPSLIKNLSPLKAVGITAIAFALLHGSAVQCAHQLIMGIMAGLLIYVGRSLWYAVLLHFLNNAYAVLVIAFTPQIEELLGTQTEVSAAEFFTPTQIIASLIMMALGLCIMIYAFQAFLRRFEKKKNIPLAVAKPSARPLKDFEKRLTAASGRTDGTVENEEKKSIGIVFWISFGLICLIVIFDLVRGFTTL